MITMKLSSPQSYGLWDGDRLFGRVRLFHGKGRPSD